MPTLPIELLELIISYAWHFPAYSTPIPPRLTRDSLAPAAKSTPPTPTPYTLSAEERISLMLTLPRVSKSILALYLRVSSRDVYIPSPAYAERWMRCIVTGFDWPASVFQPLCQAAGCDTSPETFSDVVCESVNFVLDPRVLTQSVKSKEPSGVLKSMVNSTLYLVNCSQSLPALTNVGIEILERGPHSGRLVGGAKEDGAKNVLRQTKNNGLLDMVEKYVVEDMLADCVPPQVRSLEVVYYVPAGWTRTRRVSL